MTEKEREWKERNGNGRTGRSVEKDGGPLTVKIASNLSNCYNFKKVGGPTLENNMEAVFEPTDGSGERKKAAGGRNGGLLLDDFKPKRTTTE